jgi:hypothetical protein
MTALESRSLGAVEYRRQLAAVGLLSILRTRAATISML